MEVADIPLIAGHPALDFTNALEGRATPAEVNYLPGYAALARWAARAGLVTAASQRVLLRAAASHPGKARRSWAEAMALRRDLDAIFRARARGKPPPEPALRALNRMLACAHAHRRLRPSHAGAVDWAWDRPGAILEIVTWEIAFAAAGLLTGQDKSARIRICGNPVCDWMFLDESRTGQRRWCRMNVCGNAAKVRRFRERRRAEQT
jgi:predicted RNA-binding Zn ribbon-like protein